MLQLINHSARLVETASVRNPHQATPYVQCSQSLHSSRSYDFYTNIPLLKALSSLENQTRPRHASYNFKSNTPSTLQLENMDKPAHLQNEIDIPCMCRPFGARHVVTCFVSSLPLSGRGSSRSSAQRARVFHRGVPTAPAASIVPAAQSPAQLHLTLLVCRTLHLIKVSAMSEELHAAR